MPVDLCTTHRNEAYGCLEKSFLKCYHDELLKHIIHKIHETCPACYRKNMLRLRPMYDHSCTNYVTEADVFAVYGYMNIKKMSANNNLYRIFCDNNYGLARSEVEYVNPDTRVIDFPVYDYWRNFERLPQMMSKLSKLFTDAKIVYVQTPCKMCYSMRKFQMKGVDEVDDGGPPPLEDGDTPPLYDINDEEQFPELRKQVFPGVDGVVS